MQSSGNDPPWPTGLATPSATTASSRRRANQGSSESHEGPLGAFAISNTRYRVGAPEVLPLPLESDYTGTHDSLSHQLQTELIEITDATLKANGIAEPSEPPPKLDDPEYGGFEIHGTYDHIHIVFRSRPRNPRSRLTILIVADWNESSPRIWEKAVKELKMIVDGIIKDRALDVTVAIEMISTHLTFRKYVSNVEEILPLSNDWPAISAKVCDILHCFSSSQNELTMIGLTRFGTNPDHQANPITVYVALGYGCTETMWPPIIKAIESCLNEYKPLELKLWVEHNVIEMSTFPLVPPRGKPLAFDNVREPYGQRLRMGSEIGMASYTTTVTKEQAYSAAGALGCYLEYKSPNQSTWKKLALTNYHVVRPAVDGFLLERDRKHMLPPDNNTALHKADRVGFTLETVSQLVEVEHPSRRYHNHSVAHIENEIKKEVKQRDATTNPLARALCQKAVDEWGDVLQRKKDFFDTNQHLAGRVRAASGFKKRSPAGHRLDWALIEVHEHRQGSNDLTSKAEWDAIRPEPDMKAPVDATFKLGQQKKQLRSLPGGTVCFLRGPVSGPSSGQYSVHRACKKLHHDKYMRLPATNEHYFMSTIGPNVNFVQQGDSGSVVYDEEGCVLGLVYRGHEVQNSSAAFTYVTPIEDVFESILARTGISEIRIAED